MRWLGASCGFLEDVLTADGDEDPAPPAPEIGARSLTLVMAAWHALNSDDRTPSYNFAYAR